jgi:hypothetical protein
MVISSHCTRFQANHRIRHSGSWPLSHCVLVHTTQLIKRHTGASPHSWVWQLIQLCMCFGAQFFYINAHLVQYPRTPGSVLIRSLAFRAWNTKRYGLIIRWKLLLIIVNRNILRKCWVIVGKTVQIIENAGQDMHMYLVFLQVMFPWNICFSR